MKIFKQKFRTSAVVFLLLAIVFGAYVQSEKQVDRANESRLKSYLLVDELRQSSDELTRMARSYVVTGDQRFKKYFQEILDIRDGRVSRPDGYNYIYWDIVLADDHPRKVSTERPIALLELMRNAGFNEGELQKLVESKANSDVLAGIELKAIKLAESVGHDTTANHELAEQMMHDKYYHKAKADIMRPLSELYKIMDKRTFDKVRTAERNAVVMRIVFMTCFLGAVIMLWTAYRELNMTLGESADTIHSYLLKIGQGDISTAIPVPPGAENSVLAGLATMQTKLQIDEEDHIFDKQKIAESESRLRTIIESEPECIKIIDARGRLIMMNPAGLAMLEADSLDQVSGKQVIDLISPEYREQFAEMHKRVIAGESMNSEFEIIGLRMRYNIT